jgi:3-dehydroquinate synthase
MIIKVNIDRRKQSYRLHIEKGLINKAGVLIKRAGRPDRAIILTNSKVKRSWLAPLTKSLESQGIDFRVISLPDGEKYKNIDSYEKIIGRMIAEKIDRRAILITLGGGVIGDLGGFVAATYKRGIRLVHIPTSLVAQVDASIGGKTALDTAEGKNMIGAYYNPEMVLTDPDILTTLDERQFRNGLFEIIKIALVYDRRLFDYISRNLGKIAGRDNHSALRIVSRAAGDKAKIVTTDPYEENLRMILNFGHTLGHALETANEYRGLSHGEAVGYGMLLALHLSRRLNIYRAAGGNEPDGLIKSLLQRCESLNFNPAGLWKIICNDKKAVNGEVRFVLLEDIARPLIREISKSQFSEALKGLCGKK